MSFRSIQQKYEYKHNNAAVCVCVCKIHCYAFKSSTECAFNYIQL